MAAFCMCAITKIENMLLCSTEKLKKVAVRRHQNAFPAAYSLGRHFLCPKFLRSMEMHSFCTGNMVKMQDSELCRTEKFKNFACDACKNAALAAYPLRRHFLCPHLPGLRGTNSVCTGNMAKKQISELCRTEKMKKFSFEGCRIGLPDGYPLRRFFLSGDSSVT